MPDTTSTASENDYIAKGLPRRRNPPLSCAAAGRAAVMARKISVRLIARVMMSFFFFCG